MSDAVALMTGAMPPPKDMKDVGDAGDAGHAA